MLEAIADTMNSAPALVEKQRFARLVAICKKYGITEVWSTFTDFDYERNAKGHMAIKAPNARAAKNAEKELYALLAPDFLSDDEDLIKQVSFFLIPMFPDNPARLEGVEDLLESNDYVLIYVPKEA